ncbi:OmpA family protein [Cupriavidus sp. 2TAF22]|uniref:OmpA family protein n=1 Tax=unclassified Cupriavidus TaxID=2640874 RepID=UPI003F939C87
MSSNLSGSARRCLAAVLAAATLALGACQSTSGAGLSVPQIETLKEQGFTQTESGWELNLSEKVLFGLNEDTIGTDHEAIVLRIGMALKSAGIGRVRLDGHTDDSGPADYNQQLSVRRAQAVARVLAVNAFAAQDIEVRGLGKSRPVADNRTAAGRAENRRVAIVVTVE